MTNKLKYWGAIVFEMEGDIANAIRKTVEEPLIDKVKNAANDCPVEAIVLKEN